MISNTKYIHFFHSGLTRIVMIAVLLASSTLTFANNKANSEPQKKKPLIPAGSWVYGVYSGKTKIGSATATVSFESDIITSITETTLKKDDAIVMMKEIIKESFDYKPVSFFTSNIVLLKNRVDRNIITADFDKGTINLKHGTGEKTVIIKDDFIISGNSLTEALLRSGIAKGFKAKAQIYNPVFDEDKLIEIYEIVIGKETVTLPTGKIELYHTVETIGTINNIHNYIDIEGTIYKTTIPSPDGPIDLILESRGTNKPKQ